MTLLMSQSLSTLSLRLSHDAAPEVGIHPISCSGSVHLKIEQHKSTLQEGMPSSAAILM